MMTANDEIDISRILNPYPNPHLKLNTDDIFKFCQFFKERYKSRRLTRNYNPYFLQNQERYRQNCPLMHS